MPLHTPQLACQVRRDLPLADLTVFEMITLLKEEGWDWQKLPPRVDQRQGLVYRPGSPKTWYAQSMAIE
eukprot:12172748-Alexandrium_andersonii.AAC.1